MSYPIPALVFRSHQLVIQMYARALKTLGNSLLRVNIQFCNVLFASVDSISNFYQGHGLFVERYIPMNHTPKKYNGKI